MNFDFFRPIRNAVFEHDQYVPSQFGYSVQKQRLEDFQKSQICFIGIETEAGGMEADLIRKTLYRYHRGKAFPRIYDLGNISIDLLQQSEWHEFYALVNECIEQGLTVCFIGGKKDFLIEIQSAYSFDKRYTNLGLIDKEFNIEEDFESEVTNKNFLYRIYTQQPNYLFNFLQLGYQQYLVNPSSVQLLKQLNFEEYRLGAIRDEVQHTEPFIRDLDILGVSVNALKQAETGGQPDCSPNGLYSDELAQMMRYAGSSDKLSTIGFFDYDAVYDTHGACAQLISQSIWCFLEGASMRMNENPDQNSNAFVKYTVHNNETDLDLLFLKSKRSGRWWIEMPADKALLNERFFIPCSYNDYEIALDGDVPERWIKGFNKLSNSKQP